jgi:hypothetical protein
MEPEQTGHWRDGYSGSTLDDPKWGEEVIDRSPSSHGGTYRCYELKAIHDPAQHGRRLLIRRFDFNPTIHEEW